MRKEVDMDCVTPSHPNKIPHGESLDINQLLNKGSCALLDPEIRPHQPISLDGYEYTPQTPTMVGMGEKLNIDFLKAQITNSDKELGNIVRELTKRAADTRSKKPSLRKTFIPRHPQTQQPRLMEMPYVHEPNWSWKQASTSAREFKAREWVKPQVSRPSPVI